ncbi:MAG: FMN-dependent NADH-azoreductase [Rhodospirillaceae bacterium]|nr:FMN-dependent NADH-azoreductase [Rhodospirillaceae bacterium]
MTTAANENAQSQPILLITSSPNTVDAVSTNLAKRLAEGLAANAGDGGIVHRDLGADPLPHLDSTTIGAFYTPEEDRSDEQKAAIALSDELVDELIAAGPIVIAAPMHNFGISSLLKVWLDHIARYGRTFLPTGEGPKGLLADRPVYIVTSRGGVYGPGTPFNHLDLLEPYLRRVLNFVGLEDITVVYAEGTGKGTDGIQAAEAEIESLIAAEAA